MKRIPGLLLDVDGPIASPITRKVRPEILEALGRLNRAGSPIVFNTGRSDAFIREEVFAPFTSKCSPSPYPLHAVCEKGASWLSLLPDATLTPLSIDQELALPQEFTEHMRTITEDFSSTMFFDETKRAMVSVEQRTDVAHSSYLNAQPKFDARAAEALQQFLPHRDVRIDPTIISTDIEDARLGKDLGADRALELVRADGLNPHDYTWYTVGDSRTDYAMAERLHALGYQVKHVDVRPADGLPANPGYPILTYGDLIHDDAGLAFLQELSAPETART